MRRLGSQRGRGWKLVIADERVLISGTRFKKFESVGEELEGKVGDRLRLNLWRGDEIRKFGFYSASTCLNLKPQHHFSKWFFNS